MQPTDKELAEARELLKYPLANWSIEDYLAVDDDEKAELLAKILKAAALHTATQAPSANAVEAYPDATGWHGPGHARPGDTCPTGFCGGKLIGKPSCEADYQRLHCDKCGKGSWGLHTPPTTPASASEAAPDWRTLLKAVVERDGECNCINISRKSEHEYEAGKCPHQLARAALNAPASGEGQQGSPCCGYACPSCSRCYTCNKPHTAGEAAILQRATQQQAGQAVAWMTPDAIKHLDKQNGVTKVDAWNCSDGNNRVPVFTTPQTPGGYVLVPREPTEAMLQAAYATAKGGAKPASRKTQRARWRAMIAASEASGGEGDA